MKRKLVALLFVTGGLLAAGPGMILTGAASNKVPPVCVEKTVHGAHIQVGYCP